jgi:hypothetical protein
LKYDILFYGVWTFGIVKANMSELSALGLEEELVRKLVEAGFNHSNYLPNRLDHIDWRMVQSECGLTGPQLIRIKNVLFPPPSTGEQPVDHDLPHDVTIAIRCYLMKFHVLSQ